MNSRIVSGFCVLLTYILVVLISYSALELVIKECHQYLHFSQSTMIIISDNMQVEFK